MRDHFDHIRVKNVIAIAWPYDFMGHSTKTKWFYSPIEGVPLLPYNRSKYAAGNRVTKWRDTPSDRLKPMV